MEPPASSRAAPLLRRLMRVLGIACILVLLRVALHHWRRRRLETGDKGRRGKPLGPLLKTQFKKRDDFAHILFKAAREASSLPMGMGVIHDSITGGKGDVILITRPEDVFLLLSRSVAHNLGPLKEVTQSFIGAYTLFSQEGEAWREHRQRLAKVLTPSAVREKMRPAFEQVSFQLCTKLAEWIKFQPIVDFHSLFQRLHIACIGQSFLNDNLGFFQSSLMDDTGECKEILAAFEYLLAAMSNHMSTSSQAAEWKMHAHNARARVEELMKLRTYDDIHPDDLVQFMFAGYNTVAVAQSFTLFYMTQNPAWMAQVQKEVDSVLGSHDFARKGGAVEVETLPILRAVFLEALRLVPPTVFTARKLEEDFDFGDYMLPKDTDVFVPILFLNQDKASWGNDANMFHPSRWLQPGFEPKPGSYVPFSYGPRACLGQQFAMDSTLSALAMLLFFFSFETPAGSRQVPKWTGFGIRPFDEHLNSVCLNLKVTKRIRPKKSGAVVVRKDTAGAAAATGGGVGASSATR